MLITKILEKAQPFLTGRKVRDLVIGISLMAVELDNGFLGVSYVLREGLKSGCSIFPYGQKVIGEEACSIAEWTESGKDNVQRGIAMAVLAAASRAKNLEDADTPGRPFGIDLKKTDTMAMIGFIAPLVSMLSSRVKKMYIFDEGISKCGGFKGEVVLMKEQPRLLPHADIVMLSGTSIINGSAEEIISMCEKAREIIMIGASTPMYPEAFLDTPVTVLAGSWWKKEYKKELFKKISLACGITELSEYVIKKAVKVSH
jgi:uncharacterized protein